MSTSKRTVNKASLWFQIHGRTIADANVGSAARPPLKTITRAPHASATRTPPSPLREARQQAAINVWRISSRGNHHHHAISGATGCRRPSSKTLVQRSPAAGLRPSWLIAVAVAGGSRRAPLPSMYREKSVQDSTRVDDDGERGPGLTISPFWSARNLDLRRSNACSARNLVLECLQSNYLSSRVPGAATGACIHGVSANPEPPRMYAPITSSLRFPAGWPLSPPMS